MRKLLNRALALIYLIRAVRHWIMQGHYDTKAERSGYGWDSLTYNAKAHEMRGDALGYRAALLWRSK